MEKILIVIGAVLLIAAVNEIGPRIRVPPALALVVIGAVIGITPFVPELHVDPEWILVGVLPPLLYSAAVSMPTMDFRRDFGAISGLSVLLVLISAVVIGYFIYLVVPGIELATGIAVGAIVSPTDAVATSIAKKMGVPSRVTAVLEGESMLNDGAALVLLRAATAATAASISFGGVALNFAYAVAAAVVIGAVVGVLNLRVRAKVSDAAVNTVISFTVPYLAYLPAETLGASGLVAAVTAGLITGAGAARYLTPQHRLSDTQNWHAVEVILEGGVFFLMGLELWSLMLNVQRDHDGVLNAVWLGLAALALTVVLRSVYVVPLLWLLDKRRQRGDAIRPMLENFSVTPVESTGDERTGWRRRLSRWRWRTRFPRGGEPGVDLPPTVSPDTAGRINARVTRAIADIDYYEDAPLGPKEATIIVWAGLRGVVTVAAAQTLPEDTPARALLVLTAFVVAAASLLLQGGTLGWLIRALRISDTSGATRAERLRLRAEMDQVAHHVTSTSEQMQSIPWLRDRIQQANEQMADETEDDVSVGPNYSLKPEDRAAIRTVRREVLHAQRRLLLRLRGEGTYSSEVLSRKLGQLDAEEISLDLQAGP